MVDFRWHTASLVAVFLALGLGVLIGGAATGGGALRARQQAAMRRIEGQFATLRGDRTQLAEARRFAAAAVPWIVAGRLAGRTVAVLAMGEPGVTPQVVTTLALSGASSYTLDVPAGLAPATAAGWASYGPGSRAQQLRRAAADLAGAVFGDGGSGLADLETEGAVLADGAAKPADAVVVLVGPKVPAEAIDRVVGALVAARPAATPIVGAQAAGTPPGGAFTGRGLAVVDDVGQPAGQAALVLCLTGIAGHFGDLPGAAGPLPAYAG